jgi:DNA (cytosine-5)-methyltransferase 1
MFDSQGSLDVSQPASDVVGRMRDPVTTPYSVISLYSGAGGLDLGFARAGFDLKWAIDQDRFAVQTYNACLAPHAVCADVLAVEPPESLAADVVIGGPPCQGFSVIGRMDPTDPRSRHVTHFLDVVERVQPRGFLMENVKALAVNERWAGLRARLLDRACSLGYESTIFVLNARDYGVPQARERMFLVGVRDGTPIPPQPTTRDRPITVREALAGLPTYGAPGNDQRCAAQVVPARAPILRPSPFRGSLLFNGSGRPLDLDAPAKTLPASMGGNATPIIDQEQLESGAEPWVVGYHRRLRQGGSPLRRAPGRLRRLTVQEAAALQTFPADWRFAGPRVSQYRQIGNAVPPRLAEAVARSLMETLMKANVSESSKVADLVAA